MKISVSRDYLLTYITEFLVIVSGVLIYRLAADKFQSVDFALYAIIRRTVSLILPLVLLGVGVGIPRYVALTVDERDRDTYLLSGIILSAAVFIVFLVLALILNDELSYLLFSSSSYSSIIAPLVLMTGALLLHSTTYSYLRGRMMMERANMMQLLNLGISPLVGFFLKDSLTGVLYLTAISWSILSLIFLFVTVSELKFNREIITSQLRELFIYGLNRVPGDLLLAAFFAVPAFIVSHQLGVEAGGDVAFSVTLLSLAGSFFGPVSLLLLPKAAAYIKESNIEGIRAISRKLLLVTTGLTFAGVILFIFFSELFLELYLGKSTPGLLSSVRIIIVGSVGYCMYIVLRSILDAVSVKGLNTFNILLSFVLFSILAAGIYFFGVSAELINYAFVLSITLLGVLTYFTITSFLNKQI